MAGPINVAKRLSQRDWLERAMSVLAREGGARVTIDRLCQELGVTKGSFIRALCEPGRLHDEADCFLG